CAADAADPDFAGAAARSRTVAENLQSYTIEASIAVASGVTGMGSAMTMDVSLRSAAVWPDRLANRQEGTGFVVDLGTGPGGSWLHVGQLGTVYLGPAATLTRDLEGAGQFELSAEKVYNFYAGLADYVLPAEPAAVGEPAVETLTVGGKEIRCLVFTIPAEDGEPTEGQVLRGEGRAWYDPASGLLLKSQREIRTVQQGNPITQTQTATVDRFTLDQPVADERFVFAAPAGVRTVDDLDKLTNPDSMAGQPAPDITLTGFDGTTTRISDLRGKVVFLNFWATWCPPCRIEMPHIQTIYEELEPAGEVVFLGASSEPKGTVEAFLAKNPYTFPIVGVGEQDVAVTYRTQSIPAIFVIDKDGVIRAHLVGAQSEEQMRRALAKAGIGG
ncbi:MAG: TlpA family protein disulfide reductase, partial [Krumholzibacteria bacterium]|nr:TlpA family protein disulfide reductase [Candidatus Krumholzibacteria bacterium]